MPDKVSLRLKPTKVSRAGAKKMTTSSKTIAIKKSENGKAKSTEKVEPIVKKKLTLEETRKMLDEQISVFQKKAELIKNRDLFEVKRDMLLEYLKEQGTDFEAHLDSRNLVLILADNDQYSDSRNRVQISNNEIINAILRNVIVRINSRITDIEAEIVA